MQSVITIIKAHKCVRKGCDSFLAYVIDPRKEKKKLEDLKIVRYCMEVFPEELLGLLPARHMEFCIDLVPSANSISKSPYRLAPSEMQELMFEL